MIIYVKCHQIKVAPVVGLADVVEAGLVQEDLLEDEGGHGLAQLRARLHDAETQRDDLRRQQEVDHLKIFEDLERLKFFNKISYLLLLTSCSSVLTRAPITPREVRRRYSKGRVLLT